MDEVEVQDARDRELWDGWLANAAPWKKLAPRVRCESCGSRIEDAAVKRHAASVRLKGAEVVYHGTMAFCRCGARWQARDKAGAML